jgi:AraC family transcriptional regulator
VLYKKVRRSDVPFVSAVERAINCMWERYSEPLSLTDIARSAILSRFHFSRVFKEATGVSPGQFLTAVRIHQAKRMLLATSMNVADVSAAVGYSSPGSFTNRFTDSVGMSPSRFRAAAQESPPTGLLPDPAFRGLGRVTGTVQLPADRARVCLYLGVFDTGIMQRRPKAAVMLSVESAGPHPCRLDSVPDGRWFVHAAVIAESGESGAYAVNQPLIGMGGPMRVSGGVGAFAVTLRPRIPTDPPVLLAMPELTLAQPVGADTPVAPAGLVSCSRLPV